MRILFLEQFFRLPLCDRWSICCSLEPVSTSVVCKKSKEFSCALAEEKGGRGRKHIYVAYLYLYYWLEIKGGRVRLVRLHVALQSNSVCDRPLHVSPYCAHIKLKSGDTTTRSIFQDRFSSTPLHFLFERFVFPFLLFLPVFWKEKIRSGGKLVETPVIESASLNSIPAVCSRRTTLKRCSFSFISNKKISFFIRPLSRHSPFSGAPRHLTQRSHFGFRLPQLFRLWWRFFVFFIRLNRFVNGIDCFLRGCVWLIRDSLRNF